MTELAIAVLTVEFIVEHISFLRYNSLISSHEFTIGDSRGGGDNDGDGGYDESEDDGAVVVVNTYTALSRCQALS